MMTEEKRGPGRPPKAEKMQFIVQRDYWPTESQEDRVCKGTVVEMDAAEAIAGIESGALKRA